MIPCSVDQCVCRFQMQVSDKKILKALRHIFIINKSYRAAFFPLFDASRHFLDKALGQIVIHIKFSITGQFNGVGFELIIVEN